METDISCAVLFSFFSKTAKIQSKHIFSKNHILIYLLTSLAQAILRNIVP